MEEICQSCGMPITNESQLGTNADGSPNRDYCVYCFQRGRFMEEGSMEEMIERCAMSVIDFNCYLEAPLTEEQAAARMREEFPRLKRWMPFPQKACWVMERTPHVILSSVTTDGYPRALAVSVARLDGIKSIWFATSLSSQKVNNFALNPKAGVCAVRYGDCLSLVGNIMVLTDSATKQSCWRDELQRFFPQGPLDPDFCVLHFRTVAATLWIDGEVQRVKMEE